MISVVLHSAGVNKLVLSFIHFSSKNYLNYNPEVSDLNNIKVMWLGEYKIISCFYIILHRKKKNHQKTLSY